MKVKNFVAAAALAVLGFGAVGSAQAAGSSTATFQVKMTITSSCLAVTAPNDINLGSVTATSTAVTQNSSSTLSVYCSKNTPFTVGLATSATNGGGSAGTGYMKGETHGDLVPYSLSNVSAGGAPWGNTTGTGGNVVSSGIGAGMATAVPLTIYAQATNANFSPDTYSDTVTVNLTY